MKRIDIIIPAYKAQDTIERTIASISTQSIAKDIQVTIVNDCDGIGYKKVINRFKGIINIREVVLKQNGGPGVARQIGLLKTNLPFVTFIDADDTFYNPFSVEIMLKNIIEIPNAVVSVGNFVEQVNKDGIDFVTHAKDTIWMFGKMYKRSFLNKYSIQFNQTRANEDTGFNTIVSLCSSEKENIAYHNNIVYVWWFKEDSITRVNNFEYTYNQSFVGYTENMLYAIQHSRQVNPFNSTIDIKAIQVMASLYIYFMKTKFRDPRFIDQNFEWCKKYYDTIFKEILSRIPYGHVTKIIGEKIAQETPTITDILLDMTFYQFLEALENEGNESEVVENGKE